MSERLKLSIFLRILEYIYKVVAPLGLNAIYVYLPSHLRKEIKNHRAGITYSLQLQRVPRNRLKVSGNVNRRICFQGKWVGNQNSFKKLGPTNI